MAVPDYQPYTAEITGVETPTALCVSADLVADIVDADLIGTLTEKSE